MIHRAPQVCQNRKEYLYISYIEPALRLPSQPYLALFSQKNTISGYDLSVRLSKHRNRFNSLGMLCKL